MKLPAVTVQSRTDITDARERVSDSCAEKLLGTTVWSAPAVPGMQNQRRLVMAWALARCCSGTYGVVRTLAGTALAGGRALSATPSASATVPLALRLAPTLAAGWSSVHKLQPRCVPQHKKHSTCLSATPTATHTPATPLPGAPDAPWLQGRAQRCSVCASAALVSTWSGPSAASTKRRRPTRTRAP